jgi:DNA polymerase III subunit epsilon
MKFVAVDVETANSDSASICQIGAAWFADGAVEQTWVSLVDPRDFFSPWNIAIHGIGPRSVSGAPTWPQLFGYVEAFLRNQVVVCHTLFDRTAIARAGERHGFADVGCTWLDSCRLARQAWPDLPGGGYGLANLARILGIAFRHHDALEDARAAGEIVVRALEHTGQPLEAWLARAEYASGDRVLRRGNPEGPLAGEVLVFTGALSVARSEAVDLAAQAGCTVANAVTTTTTLLVAGDHRARRPGGNGRSSKHRRAEHLIARGQAIRIITEAEFRVLVRMGASAAGSAD